LANRSSGVAGGQGDRGDRPGVDHRVLRRLGFVVDADFVERLTGGFDADLGVDGGFPDLVECQRVGERLGDGLDGEFGSCITGFVEKAVRGRQCEPETRRVDLGELGDVVGQGAVGDVGVLRDDLVQIALHQVGHA
jgi:hypothetical protein